MSKYLGIAYNLRLPPELKERIAESAKAHNRSMNADIVARLEKSFDNDNKQAMLHEEASILAIEHVVSKVIRNAVKGLIEQGVTENVIKAAFKPEK